MPEFSQAKHALGIPEVLQHLGEFLRLPPEQMTVRSRVRAGDQQVDAVVESPRGTFAIQCKTDSSLASIVQALAQAQRVNTDESWIPVIATRYMSAAGKQKCQEAGVSWLDMAGNSHIEAEGLYVHVEGLPNKHKPSGRPSSVFAPKSSRISRWLLIHSERYFHQRELAHETKMDEGFTSRIVARLEDERLVRRNRQGQIRVSNPDLLLDAWAEKYDFFKHEIHRSHMPARSGPELLKLAYSRIGSLGWDTAATGLAAAWAIHPFADFRITTLYVKRREDAQTLWVGAQSDPVGTNLWLVEPNDAGVFQGGGVYGDGTACVHPIQVWLDLQAHPERSAEAAQQLRATFPWRNHAR